MKNLEIKYINIDELKPYEKNPRKNDDAVPYVAESIRQYGFKVPIVVDRNNVIVAGHTRYKAAKALELESVPCVVADDLSDEQIKAYRIADNKVSDFSLWDNALLLEELDSLTEDLFTGFDESEIFDKTNFEDMEVMDESDNDVLEENEQGVMYEITFKSQDQSKIQAIKQYWEENFGDGQ